MKDPEALQALLDADPHVLLPVLHEVLPLVHVFHVLVQVKDPLLFKGGGGGGVYG